MHRWHRITLVILILSVVGVGLWEYRWDFDTIERAIRLHPLLGSILYIALLITSVVALPFSSLPLLPLAAGVFGFWTTAILSILGWWIGCLIAFHLARLGRPILEKIASLEAIDRIERRIPQDVRFGGIVILRMIFPVDIVSFALGLLTHLPFSTYAIASLFGIVPFAFVWSAAAGELARGALFSSVLILTVMTVAVLMIRRTWRGHR